MLDPVYVRNLHLTFTPKAKSQEEQMVNQF
jgi:hypothetical protein